MASVVNRSPLVVRVGGKPKFDRQFPVNQHAAAQAYAAGLQARGLAPRIEQLDSSFQVRVTAHDRTRPTFQTFASLAAAQSFATVADGDRARGLYVEYTAAHRVTFKALIEQYVRGPLTRTKSYEVARLRLGRICREHEDLVCRPFAALLANAYGVAPIALFASTAIEGALVRRVARMSAPGQVRLLREMRRQRVFATRP